MRLPREPQQRTQKRQLISDVIKGAGRPGFPENWEIVACPTTDSGTNYPPAAPGF